MDVKNLIRSLFKGKVSKFVAVLGLLTLGFLQHKGVISLSQGAENMTAVSFVPETIATTDSVMPLEAVSTVQQDDCQVFPATAEVNAEVDLFSSKVDQIQKGFMDQSASNPFQACAKSAGAQAARQNLKAVSFPSQSCRKDHQKQLEALQNAKSSYYERYLALSREPACAGLLSAMEGLKQVEPAVTQSEEQQVASNIPAEFSPRGVQ